MILDSTILGEIQDALVEPNDLGLTWPSGLWTTAEVVDSLNQHQRQFLMETQAVVTRSSQGIIPATPRQPITQSWIASRRVAFQPDAFDLQNGLSSFWRLNEAAALTRVDSIGPNNLADANLVGAAPGKVQGAATFTRTLSQNLAITDAAQVGLNPGITDFAISFWFYPVGTTGNAIYYPMCKGGIANAPQANGYEITLTGSGFAIPNRLGVAVGDSVSVSRNCQFDILPAYTMNAWNHIVLSFDRSAIVTAWLNGAEATPREGAGTNSMSRFGSTSAAINPSAPFSLGAASANGGGALSNYYDGRLDAVGFWTRTLAPEEAEILWNQGLGRELIPSWFAQHIVPTTESFQALSPGDQFEMDNFSPLWASSPKTRPTLYSDADPQTLELVLLPPSVGNGTLHFLFVEQPTPLTGLGVPFSVPDEFVPTIKWGTIKDMLGKVGRAHDPIRAKVAGDLWDFGIAAAKALMQGFAP